MKKSVKVMCRGRCYSSQKEPQDLYSYPSIKPKLKVVNRDIQPAELVQELRDATIRE